MEVTTWTEALRCKRAAVGRLSERAGRNASERRAGLEKVDAEADPPMSRGRLPATGAAQWGVKRTCPVVSAGVLATACTRRGVEATREALSVARTRQPGTREGQLGPAGWRIGP